MWPADEFNFFFVPFSVLEQETYFKETSDRLEEAGGRVEFFFFLSCSSTEQSNYFKEMFDEPEVAGG